MIFVGFVHLGSVLGVVAFAYARFVVGVAGLFGVS